MSNLKILSKLLRQIKWLPPWLSTNDYAPSNTATLEQRTSVL